MKHLRIKSLMLASICLLPINVYAQSSDAARALIRLDGLEAQIRDLTNRIEMLEAQNANLKEMISNTAAKAPVETSKTTNPPIPNQPTETIAPEANNAAQPTNNNQNAQPVANPTTNSVNAAPTAAQILTNAKLSIQQGAYANAETTLLEFTTANPKAPETPEALWLLGETRFVQQAWAPAAQAYVQYLTIAPTGPKASDVLVRIAGAFRELGDNPQRCKALSEYKKRTPNPAPYLKARADAEIAKATCQ